MEDEVPFRFLSGMDGNQVEFFVDQCAGGRITPRALVASEGTISGPFVPELLEKRAHVPICRLAGCGWFFNIGYTAGKLVIQRPNAQVSIDSDWCRGYDLPSTVLFSWRLDSLLISFGSYLEHWNYPQAASQASPCPPPQELVRWVRTRELTAVAQFASEADFVERVHSSLQRFEERIGPLLCRDFFWDVERHGNKIVRRRPKRETEIQSLLHAMLVDHMLMSNIDIQPEARTTAGTVDFMLTGTLADGRRCKVCIEFKSAHSPDLISGLAGQLRSYMDATGILHGAYCVLDYRCEHFAKPSENMEALLGRLHAADVDTPNGQRYPVKVHWFRLADRAAV